MFMEEGLVGGFGCVQTFLLEKLAQGLLDSPENLVRTLASMRIDEMVQ